MKFLAQIRGAFPIADRELTARGKSRLTYALRAISVSALLIPLAGVHYGILGPSTIGIGASELLGHFIWECTTSIQFFIVFVLGSILTAPLIANEKRENTLLSLLLADLRGWDTYLGK